MVAASEIAPVTTMASAMLFGTITFTTVALYVRFKLGSINSSTSSNDPSSSSIISVSSKTLVDAAFNPRSTAFDSKSITSIFTLLYHSSIFGLILMYAYICEYHPPFPHASKTYDRDEFFFYTAALFVASYFTIKNHLAGKKQPVVQQQQQAPPSSGNAQSNHDSNNKDCLDSYSCCNTQYNTERTITPVDDRTEVLNRDQTEEWKGWMQFMFLLYHYFHAEEVYNSIRIMITCYVWMTGFGNFSFFYIKGDYSFIRVIQMLWRLNFLVIFLCLTQGTTYILYYICLLHTYFFLMVYVAMRVGKDYNYTKWGIRIKLLVLAVIIFLLWDVDTGIFQLIHRPFLGETPMLGATSGALYEWYFRSSLDHWSTFLGMVFALNFPITSLFFRKLEAQPFRQHVLAKAAMGIVMLIPFIWWVINPFLLAKFDYNQTNAYYGCIPLLTYIYFRNITPYLRGHTLDLLHQIGKTTLETYLMQHHIWLTSDAKSLLTLIPGWPKMNFLLVSILYVLASRRLYTLTLFLRGMILPDDKGACIRNLAGMTAILVSYVGLAYFLKFIGLLNLMVVFIVTIGCGVALYMYIVSVAIPTNGDAVAATTTKSYKFGSYDKAAFAGGICIVVLGIIWQHSASYGAGKIKPLSGSCSKYIHDGSWIPLDTCNENTRGVSYRDYNANSLGTCSLEQDSYVWGWTTNTPSTLCRFAYKDKGTITKQLKNRQILFVGDSVVRHLYYSFCRQMGDRYAGTYNATIEKHTDFSKTYGSTKVDFRWAPYATNLTSNVDTLLAQDDKPDIVILGGGAWDRLHLYGTYDEQNALHTEIDTLATKLVELKASIPVTWVVPTTINSWALPSEEKQQNIKEEQIQELRVRHEGAGININNVSFILDGRAFTSQRVSESYDGVHYPLSVYDAGSQILLNALDWLLLKVKKVDPLKIPKPGSMDNPKLGLGMLLFVFVGIIGFDGFMGASYFAAIFVPSCSPRHLYYEAFSQLHARLGLSAIPYEGGVPSTSGIALNINADRKLSDILDSGDSKDKLSDCADDDDESQAFLSTDNATSRSPRNRSI